MRPSPFSVCPRSSAVQTCSLPGQRAAPWAKAFPLGKKSRILKEKIHSSWVSIYGSFWVKMSMWFFAICSRSHLLCLFGDPDAIPAWMWAAFWFSGLSGWNCFKGRNKQQLKRLLAGTFVAEICLGYIVMMVDLGIKARLGCYQTGLVPSCKKRFAYSRSGSPPSGMLMSPGAGDKFCILHGSGNLRGF